MVYIIEMSISDLSKSYEYKSKIYYSCISSLKAILNFIEVTFDQNDSKYTLPIHMYEYIVSEDANIGQHPFSITILLYDIGSKGFLFVQVKKRLLHNLIEVV